MFDRLSLTQDHTTFDTCVLQSMTRYYSDSDDGYSNYHRKSSNSRISGWQSPYLNLTSSPYSTSSTSNKRITIDSPFGLDKYDYSIDRSQPGRLTVTAHRKRFSSSNRSDRVAVQTLDIPFDLDLDRLESYIEQSSNRLIIDIPRLHRSSHRSSRVSYGNSANINKNLIRSPDIERMLTTPLSRPKLVEDDRSYGHRNSISGRKLEYRIDCHGYAADELEVFVQGRDLIVQGSTRASSSSSTTDPTQKRVSKKFSRKISLPNTVDPDGVLSHLENGELRIEAPLKPGFRHSDEEIIVPGPPPSMTGRATSLLISNLERHSRSPISMFNGSSASNNRYYYRENDHGTRRQRDYDRSKSRRVRSVDGIRYPVLISPREIDEDRENERNYSRKERDDRQPKTSIYQQRHFIHTKPTESHLSSDRSIYSPTKHVRSSSTKLHAFDRHLTSDEETDLRF